MLHQNKKWKSERGIALIVAVLITSALVAIGTFAMVMTNTELDISRNDRFGKEAFFITDAGGSIYTKIISDIYWDGEVTPSTYTGVTVNSNLASEIFNFTTNNDRNTDSPANNPDITFDMGKESVGMDIDWRTRKIGPGSSLQTHEGYEGLGRNKSYGGMRTYFDVVSVGRIVPSDSNRKLGVSTAQIKSVYKR